MILRTSLLSALLFCAAVPAFADTFVVTSTANEGKGSLRAVLAAAEASGGTSFIVIDSPGDIAISETLVYEGAAPLSIIGENQAVTSKRNITLLAVINGADLDVARLGFKGPGGFSITARDKNRAGKGVFVAVPADKTGTVSLRLDTVLVEGVAGHGIHVSDCVLADDCGTSGSAASISVALQDVTVTDVGNGTLDADGLRVDERGPGDITARFASSRFTGIGADGVELDEGQEGSVIVQAFDTSFDFNGIYCHPDVLEAYLPYPDYAAFDQGARERGDIPAKVIGSPDDACIEREVDLYDNGSVASYEFSIDVDDGFDVDETGPGRIVASLLDVNVIGNLDEGIDFDEEDSGSIHLTVIGGSYSSNSDDGIKLSEEDAGGIGATLVGVEALANGSKGFVFEEEDAGNLFISVVNSMASGNDDGNKTGLEAQQDDAGRGVVTFVGPALADGIDADGVSVN
ncbi:MAG: hypothetical protein ABJF50_15335 [Paracoccaceae bacterium]